MHCYLSRLTSKHDSSMAGSSSGIELVVEKRKKNKSTRRSFEARRRQGFFAELKRDEAVEARLQMSIEATSSFATASRFCSCWRPAGVAMHPCPDEVLCVVHYLLESTRLIPDLCRVSRVRPLSAEISAA